MRMLQCIGNWESHQVGRAHGERICEDFEKKKKKVQAVNRKNPPIIYYKPNKINVQSLDSRVFINVQKYCKESCFFFKLKPILDLLYFT